MEAPQAPGTQGLLEQLQTLSEGLLYLSESESPFEEVYYPLPPADQDVRSLLAERLKIAGTSKVEVEELPFFFRNHIKEDSGYGDAETAKRFQELQRFLEQHLKEVKVYRVGERKITALIAGKTESGDIAGLKTTLIET